MSLVALLFFQEAGAVAWDPIYVPPYPGISLRLVIITLLLMAFWIAVAGLDTLRRKLFKSTTDPVRIRRRIRYLRVIGQTAPMVGLLGTTLGIINSLAVVSSEKATWSRALSRGMEDVFYLMAIGILIGIAAIWTAALIRRGRDVAPPA